jgi:TPR repeat protein
MKSSLWTIPPLLLALTIPALADFSAGLSAYKKGDYATAIKEWRPLADDGDPLAQFNLGLLYQEGQGVPQDYAQAASWFRRAADQDNTKAQHNLGAFYGAGKGVKRDFVQAYMWLNICGAKGDSGCVDQRDQVAAKLKPKQLATAQRLASEWQPKKEHSGQ